MRARSFARRMVARSKAPVEEGGPVRPRAAEVRALEPGPARSSFEPNWSEPNWSEPSWAEPSFERALGTARDHGGERLPEPLRESMEDRFDAGFGHVRVHRDARASALAERVRARAFTVGSEVFFRESEYQPATEGGQRLIAHELTHVLQQSQGAPSAGGAPTIQRAPDDGAPELDESPVARAPSGDSAASAQPATPEPESPKDAELQSPAQQEAWQKDRDGTLFYATKAEADVRRTQLEQQGEWAELRVVSFKVGKGTKWRVEMRGRKKTAAGGKRTSPGATDEPKTKPEVKQAESKKPEKKPEAAEAFWIPDTQSFEDRKGAQARLDELKKADEWEQYRVSTFEDAGKQRLRVETHGKLKPGTKTFSLTFDDGPHTAPLGGGGNRTENVLDALVDKGLKGKAAFFVQTGVPIRGASPIGAELIERMQDDGHEVGIHTGGTLDHESHPDAQKAGRLEGELKAASKRIKEVTGKAPTSVRAPFGLRNEAVNAIYKKLSLKHLFWDIDGDAGGSHTAEKLKALFDAGLDALPRGAGHTFFNSKAQSVSANIVVLYHDIRKGTAANIGALIDYIRKRVPGARFEKP